MYILQNICIFKFTQSRFHVNCLIWVSKRKYSAKLCVSALVPDFYRSLVATSIHHWVPSMLTVCSSHVTYPFQSESTLYSCLNVKELLARSRREIWRLSDCNCFNFSMRCRPYLPVSLFMRCRERYNLCMNCACIVGSWIVNPTSCWNTTVVKYGGLLYTDLILLWHVTANF